VDLTRGDDQRLFREWSQRAAQPGASLTFFKVAAHDQHRTYAISLDGVNAVGEIGMSRDAAGAWRIHRANSVKGQVTGSQPR
jgi:hypothetical protein